MTSVERRGADPVDPEAFFSRLYEEQQGVIHAYLLGRTGDPEAALDLLQETFLRVWRRLPSVRTVPAERRRRWIFAVARNALTDHYRRGAASAAAYQELARQADPFAPAADEPAAALDDAEQMRLLDLAIRRLPEALRTVLLLRTVGEMSSFEIAEVLGRPAGTIRYQLSLARRQIASELRLMEEDRVR